MIQRQKEFSHNEFAPIYVVDYKKEDLLNIGRTYDIVLELSGKLPFNRWTQNTARFLSNKGVKITVRKEPWGTVADFLDPDGNYCSLRDEASFGV